MNCIQIRFQETFDYIPAKYVESDGYVYLDLDPQFDLRETKQITELTDANKLKFSFQLGFDLPWTEKNFACLKKYIHANVTDNDFKQIGVDIVAGSKIIQDNELYVKTTVKGNISAELRLGLDHWAILSSSLKLEDITHEDFEYTCENVVDRIINNYPYDDDDDVGVWFPYSDFGSQIQDHAERSPRDTGKYIIPLAQYRPYHYALSLLQKGFCEIGWNFESPILESEWGRRVLLYLVDRSYGINDDIALLNARAEIVEGADPNGGYTLGFQYGSYGRIRFPLITNDTGSNFNGDGSLYSGNGIVDITGKVVINVPNGEEMVLRIVVGKIAAASGPTSNGGMTFRLHEEYERYEVEITGNNNDVEWDFDIKGIPCYDIDELGVFVYKSENKFVNILGGSFIQYDGVRKYWDNGDTVNMGSIIDSEYEFLDLIKAISHIMNLKWYTNPITKTIKAFQPFTAEVFDETIEGFFIEQTIEDISLLQDESSMKVDTPELNQPRYLNILFKQSSQSIIEDKGLQNELWSKQIDLGEQFTVDEEQEMRNEFFEPTINTADLSVYVRASGSKINIPDFSDDNLDNWDIAPRILLGYGYVRQRINDTYEPEIKHCFVDADSTPLVATAGQYFSHFLGDEHNTENEPIESIDNITFAVNKEIREVELPTMYSICYHRWILESYNNLTVQYLVDLTRSEFSKIDFRSYYLIRHLGRTVKVKMSKVIDFHHCSNIFTPIDFVPDKQVSDLCGLIGIDPDGPFVDPCANKPVLICEDLGNGCFLFTIGGINNQPIESVTFYVGPIGSSPLTPIDNGTFMLELCNEDDPYRIRAEVNYEVVGDEDCPNAFTAIKIVDPCPEIAWEMRCRNYRKAGLSTNTIFTRSQIRWNDESIDPETISILYWRWSDTFGPAFNWQNYNIDVELKTDANGQYFEGPEIHPQDIGAGIFEARVQYQSCDPVIISNQCAPPPRSPNPCAAVDLELVCTPNGWGCFTFSLEGTYPPFLELFYTIQWRALVGGSEDEYQPWRNYEEGSEICGEGVQGKVMIHFCDNACEPICLYAECVDCDFEPGQPSNLAFCNDGNIS